MGLADRGTPGAVAKRLAALRRNVKRYILPRVENAATRALPKLKINKHNFKKTAAPCLK